MLTGLGSQEEEKSQERLGGEKAEAERLSVLIC